MQTNKNIEANKKQNIEINKELIKHIADVSRLNLSEKEINEFLPQIKEILENFSKIDDAPVDNLKPSFQPIEIKNHLRNDKIEESLPQEQVLSLSKSKDGYFLGPKAV